MAEMNRTTVRRKVWHCPACDSDVDAYMTLEVGSAETPLTEKQVALTAELTGVELSHTCPRPTAR